MRRLSLSSTERTDLKKSATVKIRNGGSLPATVYGKGVSKSLAVKISDFDDILRTPGGRLSLIDLTIDGGVAEALPVMIQAIQKNPVTGKVVHVDFHRVDLKEAVHASVPLTVIGEAPGVKLSGILETPLSFIEIKALPDAIPSHINIDISHLELGDKILVSEIVVPEGVEVIGPSPETLAVVIHLPYMRNDEPEVVKEAAAEEAAPAAE
ncbi:MAG: 50S ribosomal protein L25 [Armatimonadota bacterium]